MADVLACIDQSAYANGVCDHAGWFASDPDVGVEVLHVDETPKDGAPGGVAQVERLVEQAVRRLREEGVGPVTSAMTSGSFVDVASRLKADVIVMGKRGERSAAARRGLGSSVEEMVRATTTPICLTSKVFLPIHRVLVLLDADMDHRAAVEFVASQPRLVALPADVVVVAGPGDEPDAKVEWARGILDARRPDVFSLRASGLDEAVTRYLDSRGADLIVVSRAVIAPGPEARLQAIGASSLWGGRTPVLVC
jgi:nucleotide-binding universal stress UspA family protein